MPLEDLSEPLAVLAACALGHLEVQARRQGHRTEGLQRQLDREAATEKNQLELTLEPCPMILQLDAWGKPLVKQLESESALKVIQQLEEASAAMAKEVGCFHEHQACMDYRAGQRAGELIGSGSVEATCRQTQCRFKRPGQFWRQAGDETLLCLEMFWRNGR